MPIPKLSLWSLPAVLKHTIFGTNLDDRSTLFLGYTAETFYADIQNINCWKDKLIGLKYCTREVLAKVEATGTIHNYQQLYLAIIKNNAAQLSAWEILCLSGEPKAIAYAIANENVQFTTLGHFNKTAWHLVVISNSIKGFDFLLSQPSFKQADVQAKESVSGKNILHLAATFGHVEIMRRILSDPHFKNLIINATTPQYLVMEYYNAYSGGEDALQLAIRSGNPMAVQCLLEESKKRKFIFCADDKYFYGLGNKPLIKKILEEKLHPVPSCGKCLIM